MNTESFVEQPVFEALPRIATCLRNLAETRDVEYIRLARQHADSAERHARSNAHVDQLPYEPEISFRKRKEGAKAALTKVLAWLATERLRIDTVEKELNSSLASSPA